MLSLYFIVAAVINILAQNIYADKIESHEMDVNDRKDIYDPIFRSKVMQLFANFLHNHEHYREKRQVSSQIANIPLSNNINNVNTSSNNDLNFNHKNIDLNKTNDLFSNNISNYYNNLGTNYSWYKSNNSNHNFNNKNESYKHQYARITIKNSSSTLPKYNMRISSVHTFMPRFNKTRLEYTFARRNVQKPRYTKDVNKTLTSQQDITNPNIQEFSENKLPKSGNVNSSNSYDVTIKPYAPGYLPIPEFNGLNTSNKSNHWYNNFNVISEIFGLTGFGSNENATETTTEVVLSGCNICSSGCPIGTHRSGIFCISDDYAY